MAKLDNSAMKAFYVCPWLYFEKYENKLEKKGKREPLTFGKRQHELLEWRLREMRGDNPLHPPTPWTDAKLEAEAQVMFAAYCQQYPVENFEVIDVERYFEVPLPRTACVHCGSPDITLVADIQPYYKCPDCGYDSTQHIYIGKFDGIVREKDTGKLCIKENKTEKRGSKANLPAAWAVRPQVSLYIWAAEQVYKEAFDQILLDVLTRQSEKGLVGPSFPPRQHLQRTEQQKQDAVRNITYVADRIDELRQQYWSKGLFPYNGEECVGRMGWNCEYLKPHLYGWDDILLAEEYQTAEEYLTL